MSYKLFDLTLAVARRLGVVREGTATGGGLTTVADSVGSSGFNDDFFNRGTVWLLYDLSLTQYLSEVFRVTDFVKSSGTITHENNAANATAAGDRYAVMTDAYPYDVIVSCLNAALSTIKVRAAPVQDTQEWNAKALETRNQRNVVPALCRYNPELEIFPPKALAGLLLETSERNQVEPE